MGLFSRKKINFNELPSGMKNFIHEGYNICSHCGELYPIKGKKLSFNKIVKHPWYGMIHQKCLKKIEEGLEKKDPEFEKYRYHFVKGQLIDKDGFFQNGFNEKGIHKDTGNEYDPEGYDNFGIDKDGFRRNGFNEKGIHKDTGNEYDPEGYDVYEFNKEGIHKVTGIKYDENDNDHRGFDKNGNNARTGTKYDKNGYDKFGYRKNGYDKFGYDMNGFNKKGIHKDTGTKFDKSGYSKDGIHKDTGTKFDKSGFGISGLIAEYRGSEFEMIAFKGQEKFAKLISGGTVDFYDSDSPAYILNVKLNIGCSEDFKEKLVYTIRNSHVIKPSVFLTEKSIGAYWQIDNIEESTAKMLLERIMKNFRNKVEEF